MIFAHVNPDGTVVNVIVADDGFLAAEVAPPGCNAVDVTGKPVGIGWTRKGPDFVPPPTRSLTADRDRIVANGADVAAVTYTDTHDTAPASVTFTINGATQAVTLTNGAATVEVVTTTPGPIDVTCDAMPGTTITVMAVAS